MRRNQLEKNRKTYSTNYNPILLSRQEVVSGYLKRRKITRYVPVAFRRHPNFLAEILSFQIIAAAALTTQTALEAQN